MRAPMESLVRVAGSRFLYRLLFYLACIVALVIMAFSLVPPLTSSAQSSWLQEWLLYFTGLELDEMLIRKMAHFLEYLLLGFLASGALAQTKWGIQQAAVLFGAGFLLAFLDETLQIFSGRGPAIVDVWLDIAGLLCGILLGLSVFSLIVDFRRKRLTQ